jgi:hypothetical protein
MWPLERQATVDIRRSRQFRSTPDPGGASATCDGSNPGALTPPVPMGVPLSAKPSTALSGRFSEGLAADLLTGLQRLKPETHSTSR